MNEENPVILPLTNSIEICLVDAKDYFRIQNFKLKFRAIFRNGKINRISSTNYYGHRYISLPEFILGYIEYKMIDHIDRNALNNLPSNLRHTSQSKNIQNQKARSSSGLKGVRFHKCTKNWESRICKNGNQESIGFFATKEEAGLAYDKRAIELFGKNSYTNFKKEGI